MNTNEITLTETLKAQMGNVHAYLQLQGAGAQAERMVSALMERGFNRGFALNLWADAIAQAFARFEYTGWDLPRPNVAREIYNTAKRFALPLG